MMSSSIFASAGPWVEFNRSARFSGRLVSTVSAIVLQSLALWVIPFAEVQSQSNWQAESLVQRLPDGQAYLEVQTAWNSSAQTPSDSITITTVALQGNRVVAFEKDEVCARPALEDSVDLSHVHVRRLLVPAGPISVEWRVEQLGSVLWLHNQDVRVPVGGVPEFADPILVQTHAPSTNLSNPDLVHSGLDLIPVVGRKVPLDVASARFYAELHGLSDVVGRDSLFLFVCGWADAEGNWDPKSTKYARMHAAEVVPLFESLPCTPLSPLPDQAVLKLEARTRDGHVVVSRDVQLGPRSVSELDGSRKFDNMAPLPSLLVLEDRESLIRHLEDHLAVATTNEQNTIQHTLIPQGTPDEIRQYLTGFWMERSASPADAEAKHVQYSNRIAFVDEAYGDCKYGQGSLTEMGNIYLRFGKPNTVVQRHHEPDYYPYEIWHYYKAGRFNNKRFLFYAPHVVGECFELLHSDMLGERQNEDWLSQLRSRENRLRVTESMENRLNPRDAFSREEPEDLFYNPR